jgi:hypothetical protein
MEKLLIVLIGLILVLFLTGSSLAQEKAKPDKLAEEAQIAVPAKPPGAAQARGAESEIRKKEATGKPIHYRMGGLVIALDSAVKKITIKQEKVYRERKVTLAISEEAAKDLAGIKVGDEVNVWVSSKVITVLQKVS